MSNPVDLEWLFPVPLIQSQLTEFANHQSAFVDLALQLRSEDPGVQRSNIGGWHSADLSSRLSDAPLSWLVQAIGATARNGLAKMRGGAQTGEQATADSIQIGMDGAWFAINEQHHWHSPHTHLPSQWSGVFYVSVPASGEDDGGRLMLIDPVPLGPAYRNPINAQIRPQNGLLLIFPAYLAHMVEPYRGTDPRIAFSFNFRATQAANT